MPGERREGGIAVTFDGGPHGEPLHLLDLPEQSQLRFRQVKEVERLTVRAAVEGDRKAALAAFAGHPLVDSEDLAHALLGRYEREFPELRDLWRPRVR